MFDQAEESMVEVVEKNEMSNSERPVSNFNFHGNAKVEAIARVF